MAAVEESKEIPEVADQIQNKDEVENTTEKDPQVADRSQSQDGGNVEAAEAKENVDGETKEGDEQTRNVGEQKEGGLEDATQEKLSDQQGRIESRDEDDKQNQDNQESKGEGGAEEENGEEKLVTKEADVEVQTHDANAQTEGRESPTKEDEVIANAANSTDERVESQSIVESESVLIAPPASKTEQSMGSVSPAKSGRDFPETPVTNKDGLLVNGELHVNSVNAPVSSKPAHPPGH